MFNNIQKAIILGTGILAGGFFQSASADFAINNGKLSVKHKQDIVVTLKSNPYVMVDDDENNDDPVKEEAACLAVTFARMLSMNPVNNVTLFVTLDGVELAEAYVENDVNVENEENDYVITCNTPTSWNPGGAISLKANLEAFLDGGSENDMLVCPICWNTRKMPEEGPPAPLPDYGVLPGRTAPMNAIGTLIGNADKILDF